MLNEAEVSMALLRQRALACIRNVRIHTEPAIAGQAVGLLGPLSLVVRRDKPGG